MLFTCQNLHASVIALGEFVSNLMLYISVTYFVLIHLIFYIVPEQCFALYQIIILRCILVLNQFVSRYNLFITLL